MAIRAAVTFALLTLAGCGGSGGGGGGSGTPNAAPVFTSPVAATIPENTVGSFYNASATDADGDTVSFSISGGADAALFQISQQGALSFRAPPDFDVPGDANADNIYEVTLAASDGRATANLMLRVTITNATAGNFVVRRIVTGLSAPIFITSLPGGGGRMAVVERAGRILLLDPATGTVGATPMLDIRGTVSTDGERGMLGVAFAPDYQTSGLAYAYLTAPDGSIQVRKYTSPAGNRSILDADSSDVILSIPHPRNNHNGGWLAFGRDGLLYLATGDGGGGNDPDQNGQNRNALLGKMLRIDVSRDDFSDPLRDYGIPAANPFAGGGGAPEVWLYGLRNPFRNSFDRSTGELWIADVGQGAIEEVNRVQITQAGLNMGWPLFEGTQPLLGSNPAGITMPVLQYGHGSGALQGNSITGGHVYRGPVESLQGLYIFADFISGNIWSAPSASLVAGSTAGTSVMTNRNASFAPDAGTLTNIVGFGEDLSGNLYIVSIGGSIFAILPAS